MSRRKQSNPKPIKWPEGELEKSDVTEKLDQSDMKEIDNNQSEEGFTKDATRNEPMNTNIADCVKDVTPPPKIKVENTAESNLIQDDGSDTKPNVNFISGQMSQREQEVIKRLCFPSDLLTLRQIEETEFLQTGMPWSIITLIPVPKGSTIGSYLGESVALSSIKPGELVLQFQSSDGDLSFIKMTEKTGAWLSLLRPADHKASHNVFVYFEGGRIWCKIVEDLNKGTELVASFTTNPNEFPDLIGNKVCTDNIDIASKDMKRSVQGAAIKKQEPKSVRQGTRQSADTTSPTLKVELTPPKCLKRCYEHNTSSPDNEQSGTDNFTTRSPKTDESYKCTKFDYITNGASNSVLLKQLQSSQSGSSISDREGVSVLPICQKEEMFCKECRIQFSSVSTYRGHKELYHRFRPSEGQKNTSKSVTPGTKSVITDLALKLLSSPTLGTEGTKTLLSAQGHFNASLLSFSPYLIPPRPFDLLSKSQQGEIRKAKMTSAANCSLPSPENIAEDGTYDQPLDLRKLKSSTENDEDKRKQNNKDLLGNCSISVKSEPGIQTEQLSPPAKKIKFSTRNPDTSLSVSKTTLNIPSVLPTVLLGYQIPYVNKKPVPHLQSVSHCVECNIVFYKHENYLIHKEHYCSGRQAGKDSGSLDSDDVGKYKIEQVQEPKPEAVSASNENPESFEIKQQTIPDSVEIEDKSKLSVSISELVLKYCCIPCKIKFSSAGTLKAHKDFYCPHGKESEIASVSDSDDKSESSSENTIYHCDHCEHEFSSARLLRLHICMGDVSKTPLLRCLYCDYVTQSENRLSEHVKVHIPTKAFKCNLCGYRGNTTRGMRMHGKMHLENGEEFKDKNMTELEEPPMVPIQRNGLCRKGPFDVETELIRIKNEPYKRRRSRKSFEKSENMVPFLGHICAACGQTFGNVNDFVIHLRMHEIAALEAMKSLKSLSCEHCNEFNAESLTALFIHMQTKHLEQLPGNSKRELVQGLSEGEKSTWCDSHMSVNRFRSNSSDSSKTYHSESCHDCSNDAKCEIMPNLPQDHINHDLVDFKSNPKMSKAYEIDVDNKNTKLSIKDINKESTEEERLFEINDLELRHVENHQYDKTSSVTDDSRFKKANKQTSLSGLPNPNLVSQSHQLSPKKEPDCSTQQQPSPILHAKSEPKSPPLAKERPQFSPVRNKSISPVDKCVTQTESKLDKFSSKSGLLDLTTAYLLSQNSSNIKLECPSPPKPNTPNKSSPLSHRTPVTIPKIPLSIGAFSPKLHNFPLLFSPHAILSPYQFSHGISFLPSYQIHNSPPSVLSVSDKMAENIANIAI